ncbi:MAG: tetratricopeptide repeat protein [Bacteroidota bacterium]
MILRLIVLVVLALLGSSAFGQSPDQVFQQGNQMYQLGRLEEARGAYESIIATGYGSGELFYNLGNTYYRSGEIALAILSYERALRYMPQDDDVRHNLQLANLLITDRIEPTPQLFFLEFWDDLKNAISIQGTTWLAYLAYLLVIASLTLLLLARTYLAKKIGMISVVVSLFLFASLLILFAAKLADFTEESEAIVMEPVVTVKNSPDAGSSDAFVLHNGVKLEIVDAVNEWIEIRLADGKVGWIELSAVERI